MTQTPENQQQYGAILTILGENAEQNGKLQNKQITFTHMAIGDANDEYVQPNRKQTALVNELARIPVNSVDVLQPTPDSVPMLKVEAILPDDVNDLVIREFSAVATFDGNTYFHAIGNCARIYVPPPVNNGNVNTPVTLEMIFVITSSDPIVEIDPNVVTASREYVRDKSHSAVEQSSDMSIYPRDDLGSYVQEGDLIPAGTDAIKLKVNERIEIYFIDYDVLNDLVVEEINIAANRIKFKDKAGYVVIKKIPVYKLSKSASAVALSLSERFDLSIPIQNFGAVAGQDCTDAVEEAKIFGSNFNVVIEFPDVGLPYIVSRTIVPVSKMKWKGAGEIKLADGANCPIIENPQSPVVELDDIELHDLTINGNRENQSVGQKHNNGVHISYLKDFSFVRLKVKHCGTPENRANQTNNAIGFGLHECCDGSVTDLYLSDNQHYNLQLWECDNINVGGVISKNPGSHCFGGAGCTHIHWTSCQGYIDDDESSFEYYEDSTGQGMWFRNFEGCPVTGITMVRNGVPVDIEGAGVQFGDEESLPGQVQSPRMQKRMPHGSRHLNRDNPCSGIVRGFTFGWYAYSGRTERLNLKGAHSIDCKYGAMTLSGRMIIDGFESDGCEFGVHAAGRDHKLNGLELRNTGRRPLHVQGVRSVGSNIKIEDWGTQGRDYGIYINEYSDDCVLDSVSLYNSDPTNRVADGVCIGEHARRLSLSGNLGGLSIRTNNKYDHNIQATNFTVPDSERFKLPKSSGGVFEWIDSNGDRRYKVGSPISDTDGRLYSFT